MSHGLVTPAAARIVRSIGSCRASRFSLSSCQLGIGTRAGNVRRHSPDVPRLVGPGPGGGAVVGLRAATWRTNRHACRERSAALTGRPAIGRPGAGRWSRRGVAGSNPFRARRRGQRPSTAGPGPLWRSRGPPRRATRLRRRRVEPLSSTAAWSAPFDGGPRALVAKPRAPTSGDQVCPRQNNPGPESQAGSARRGADPAYTQFASLGSDSVA